VAARIFEKGILEKKKKRTMKRMCSAIADQDRKIVIVQKKTGENLDMRRIDPALAGNFKGLSTKAVRKGFKDKLAKRKNKSGKHKASLCSLWNGTRAGKFVLFVSTRTEKDRKSWRLD